MSKEQIPRVAIWEAGREVLTVIEAADVYESVLGWLVDRYERVGEKWCVTAVGSWTGLDMQEEYDEIVLVEKADG
jgi:hypothetical protein